LDWCAATLQPGGRLRAEANLGAQGFSCYSPRFFDDAVKTVTDLFPGYILIKLNRLFWRSIEGTRGVSSVVKMGDEPCLTNSAEIGKIRALEGLDGLVRLPRMMPPRRFRRDQQVKLLHGGPLASCHGKTVIYQGHLPEQRCQVLLHILGRGVSLVVREEDLAALPT
jgi:transcriptional antiterminator RfaH